MSKKKKKKDNKNGHEIEIDDLREYGDGSSVTPADYKKTLRKLQIELVKLQRHVIAHDIRILVIFEGRDGAGKDGTIKRITEHLSPRETRIVALSKPSDREVTQWYFQRYVPFLPAADEFVLFNRSWYNRAGVERVMGFCTEAQVAEFYAMVIPFEQMLVRSGILFVKYYLDISRKEQEKRLKDRREDPLKQWKVSPIDAEAIKRWDAYTASRDDMLLRTSHPAAPWTFVEANDKPLCRLNVIRDLLSRVAYDGRDEDLAKPDRAIVKPFSPECLVDKVRAR